jgi:phenylacetate-CoA ligase
MWQVINLVRKALAQAAAVRRGNDHIQTLQRRRLRRLVAWAREHSPFYAERLQDVDPAHFTLSQLPTLTKSEMMEHFDRLVTDPRLHRADLEMFMSDPARLGQWYLDRYAPSRTSGTQGLAAVIVQDRPMLELLFALQLARGSAFPATLTEAAARLIQRARMAAVTIGHGFYPSAVGLAYAPPAFRAFADCLWLPHVEPLDEVVAHLNAFQPHVLLAYTNVLALLAREVQAGRLHLRAGAPLREVISMSEPLSEGSRRFLSATFGLPITDNYSMGECLALSAGCPQGHGMHLNADWAILEVVDRSNRPVPPGRPGDKVLVTNLYNTVQPFLRYEVSDVVTMSPRPCPCGSPLPLICKVEGRTDDVIWVRDNGRFRPIHPYVFVDFLDESPAVGWYQVEQVERNHLQVRAAPAPHRHLSREELAQIVRQGLQRFQLDRLIAVDVEVTQGVAPGTAGKVKRITSRLGAPAGMEADGRSRHSPPATAPAPPPSLPVHR